MACSPVIFERIQKLYFNMQMHNGQNLFGFFKSSVAFRLR